jgi:short-subunit dehydrogenase
MKTVFITGAAGGVGLALAQAFAAQGHRLVLTDRDADALAGAAEQVSAEVELIVADLRHMADLKGLCARLENREDPVDILVNNAGIIVPGPVGEVSEDLMRAHVDINLMAPMMLCAAAARAMKLRRSGYIFSVVSLAAMGPMKDSAAYAASKFGMRGFMASLSLELHPFGIGVGSVFPSAVDTPMLKAEMASPDGSPLNFVGNAKPMTPDEVSTSVLKAISKGKLETWLPKSDGFLAGVVLLFPSLLRPVMSYLEKGGRKKKEAYLRGLNAPQ